MARSPRWKRFLPLNLRSLRVILMVPFAIQTFIGVGIVAYLSHEFGRETIEKFVITIVPEAKFRNELRTNLVFTLVMCAIIFSGMMLLNLLLVKLILQPIRRLQRQAQKLAVGEPLEPIPTPFIQELQQLDQVFKEMTERIQEQVLRRTQSLQAEIQERQWVEQALRHSEERLRFALDSTATNWWDWNILTNDIQWSANFAQMVGRPFGSFPENLETFFSFLHPDDRDSVMEAVRLSLEEDHPYRTEFRFLHPDGQVRWVMATGTVQRDETGQATRMSGINIDISDRKVAELALQKKEATMRALFNQAFQFTGLLKPDGTVIDVNRTALEFANLELADVMNKPFWETDWWQNSVENQAQLQRAIAQSAQGEFIRYDVENKGMDRVAIIDFSIRPIKNESDEVVLLLCEGRDITEKYEMQQALQESEERFRQNFSTTPVGNSLVTLNGHFLEINSALCDLLGYDATTLIDITLADFIHPEDIDRDHREKEQLLGGEISSYAVEKRFIHRQGHIIWGLLSMALVRDTHDRPLYFIVQIQNITLLKDAQAKMQQLNRELEQLSLVDGLTGVYNRRAFDRRILQEWERASREQYPLSLLMIDIDYFKLYNDSLGHQAGDSCLITVAQTLVSAVHRPTDMVARYGGEEFVIILGNTDLPGAIIVAERIQALLKDQQISHPQSTISEFVTISIGIHTCIPDPARHFDQCIQNADQALYQAKESGRDRYVVNSKP